jgi:non-specific serine/threonine protein kinase
MLHIVREFALERLEESGEAETLRRAHAQFVLTLGAVSPIGMRSASDARWLARLEQEHDNLRAALGWARERDEDQLSLHLGIGFAPFWWARGYYSEGRRWLTHIVAGGPSPADALEPGAARGYPATALAIGRVWALWWIAKLAWNQYDTAVGRQWVQECLDAARATGDPASTAVALAFAGYTELAPPAQDTERGGTLLAEAVALARRSRDPEVLVRVLGDKFNALVESVWEVDRARASAEELLEAASHVDNLTRLNVEAHVSATLAEIAQCQGDSASARSYAGRALRTVREHGFTLWAADCLRLLSWVADQMGLGERAARLLGASATEGERHGLIGYEESLERAAARARTRVALGEEAWATAYAAGQALSLEEAIAEALGGEDD